MQVVKQHGDLLQFFKGELHSLSERGSIGKSDLKEFSLEVVGAFQKLGCELGLGQEVELGLQRSN